MLKETVNNSKIMQSYMSGLVAHFPFTQAVPFLFQSFIVSLKEKDVLERRR